MELESSMFSYVGKGLIIATRSENDGLESWQVVGVLPNGFGEINWENLWGRGNSQPMELEMTYFHTTLAKGCCQKWECFVGKLAG